MSDERPKTPLQETVRAAVGERLPVHGSPPLPRERGNLEPSPKDLATTAAEAAGTVAPEALEERIVEVLQTVYDPEIPVNIHELGLIYGIEIDEGGNVEIRMTLTAPGCPVAGAIVQEVEFKVGQIPGVTTCRVDLVWDPPWTMDRMSEAARLQLGMF